MHTWNVTLTGRAYKQLGHLPVKVQDLVDLAVADLEAEGINPKGWDVRKTGTAEYRMRYRIIGARLLEIEVFYIGHRKDAYP